MNKILPFILLVLGFVGIVGGVGNTCYYGAWPIGVGVAVAGYLAWPKIKELWKVLNS